MEPFFHFLGSYWWLVFPLMGVMGGAGRAWEQSARRRHERRLEILKAKSELKASQAAIQRRSALGRSAGGPDAAPADTPKAQLARAMAAQDDVTHRWLEYELDVAKTIAYPAMSDGRQPLTAAFLRAKKVADGLRPTSAEAKVTPEHLADYREAVTDYEVAFELAERDARRQGDSSFTASERKRLDTAKQLLTVAVDQAATPAERQLAYKRVREELDGLISLSDGAIEVLEKKVALELSAGQPVDADAAVSAVDGAERAASASPASASPASAPPAPASSPSAPPTGPVPVPVRASTETPGRVIRPKPH